MADVDRVADVGEAGWQHVGDDDGWRYALDGADAYRVADGFADAGHGLVGLLVDGDGGTYGQALAGALVVVVALDGRAVAGAARRIAAVVAARVGAVADDGCAAGSARLAGVVGARRIDQGFFGDGSVGHRRVVGDGQRGTGRHAEIVEGQRVVAVDGGR